MPGTRDIRQRIRSVSNTAKVTNAMQLIAASKLRHAQSMVADSKNYAIQMRQVLATITSEYATQIDPEQMHPLMHQRTVKRSLLLLVTPDRGLAGALVGNLLRAAGNFIMASEVPVGIVSVGRKGERFVANMGENLIASFEVAQSPTLTDTQYVSSYIRKAYESGEYDTVSIVFGEFVNTGTQVPITRQLLPVVPLTNEDNNPTLLNRICEPGVGAVLNTLLPRYIDTQIYQAMLEAMASEHSARMIAMKNATDNANQLIDDLTLDLNKARQEYITSELLDIIGGVAALA